MAENATKTAEKPAAERQSSRRSTRTEKQATTLDDDVTKPSVTEPGDGPADTTDPTERATSVTPDKAAAALAGHGTVNAVVPLPDRDVVANRPPRGDDRTETYDVVGPDGKTVSVSHNLDSGETTRG